MMDPNGVVARGICDEDPLFGGAGLLRVGDGVLTGWDLLVVPRVNRHVEVGRLVLPLDEELGASDVAAPLPIAQGHVYGDGVEILRPGGHHGTLPFNELG